MGFVFIVILFCFAFSSLVSVTVSASEPAVWGNIVLIKLVALNKNIGSSRIRLLQGGRLYNCPKEK